MSINTWWHSGLHCGLTVPWSPVHDLGLSVWISVHFLPMYSWVSSEFSGFLPLSKNILIDRWAIAPVCVCVHGVLQ